jgi:hypothetical protein
MVFQVSNHSKLLQIGSVYPMNEDDLPAFLGVDGCYLRFLEI